MKFMLIIVAFGFDAGAHIDHVAFATKELCEKAAERLNYRVGVAVVRSECVETNHPGVGE